MQILVVGDGKVGHYIAAHLAQENHDVVMIDSNEEKLQKTEDSLDIMCIKGNGANAQTLLDANAAKADVIIATTASDEINMLCCMVAKRLGSKYSIARIRDPEYNESLALLQQEMDIDMAINPERATALEISRLLRFPFASNIESFAKGRVEMVEFRAQASDPMVGVALKDLGKHLHGIPRVLYAAVERDGQIMIPNGDFVIAPGDRVHVAADVPTITQYFRFLGKHSLRIKRVVLLGGGKISYYLAKMFAPVGIHVTIVEINPEKAADLSEQLPDCSIILGDGTDQELLEQEGLLENNALVALTDRDEENLLAGLFAVRQGVPKVIVKNNRGIYTDIINAMGLDSIVSPKAITCSNILRYVRARVNSEGTSVEKLYRMMNGKAEALEFIARPNDPYIGIPLKNLSMCPGTLVAVIVHQGKVIVPFGEDMIQAGDNVIIMSCENGIGDLNEVIRK